MEPDGIFFILGVCLFALLALLVVVRYFSLPPGHAELRLKRDELRRRLVKKRVIQIEKVIYELDESGQITGKKTQVN